MVGCQLAARVLATHGTQQYGVDHDDFLAELAKSYGIDAADRVAAHLPLRARRPAQQ